MRENELGKILPGYYADCIVVDGDPLVDIGCLQDHGKLELIVVNGRVHKEVLKKGGKEERKVMEEVIVNGQAREEKVV